jgi:hypothetical protein
MNEGLKIMLERMRTNPEEFAKNSKKWGWVDNYRVVLDADEITALDAGLREAWREMFTREVMSTLINRELEGVEGRLGELEGAEGRYRVLEAKPKKIYPDITTAIAKGVITTSNNTTSVGKLTLTQSELQRLKVLMKDSE